MNNWKYANVIPTSTWRGAMTLPRELTLATELEGVRLRQKPVRELQSQRRSEENLGAFELISSELIVTHGDLLEVIAEFEIGDCKEFGIKLRASEAEETLVGYSTHEQLLYIDRSHSGAIDFHDDFACKHSALLKMENGNITMHIFVDRSSIEVFVNEGKLVMTDQIFPLSTSTGIKLYAKDGSVKVKSLTIYTLNSIFD
jgi:fructan beta-fructosidase